MMMEKLPYLEGSLRVEMEAAGIDALIGISPENVQHLAGVFIISQRMIRDRLAFAVFRRAGAPFFVVSTVVEYTARTQSWIKEIVPYTEHAVLPIDGLIQALKERGLDRGRVWIEMGYLPARDADRLRTALPNLQILDAEGVLDRSRMIKVPDEIGLMKRNAKTWEEAVRGAYRSARGGDSERSIADRMIHNLLDAGADWVPFISFASGPERTLIGHSVPDETPVRRGDIMRVDMVGFFRGYYTDFGRMAIIGDPSPTQRDAYRRLIALQKAMIARARPGVSASDLYRESVTVGKELGMDFSMDAIGHSLGLRLHEYPILNPFESQVLVADMVMCIEIAHTFGGLGRFHVEDLIRVTEAGGERLTTLINPDEMLVVGE
jgi:Xaa-Pro aminopeptidase